MAEGYDQDKDKTLKKGKIETGDGRGILVQLCSYDGKTPKIQLTRYYVDREGGQGFAKLGRLSGDEARRVAKALVSFADEIKPPEPEGVPDDDDSVPF